MEKVIDEKVSYKFWVGILIALLHYAAVVLLAYASAWICYQDVKKAGETIIVLFPLPIPQNVLMINPLFYLLGLAVAVVGSVMLFQLHKKASGYFQIAENKVYKVVDIAMLVISCMLSLGASVFAYLNTIFPQGALKNELFFAGICTNIVPVMMILLLVIDHKRIQWHS
ncbi:MAG: hypothetical protein E7307_13400 [Butyrivibrio sp.]|nr:hypothetical protein [Butyrivibrio sp.]